jgi:hypothetical protein
MIIVGIRITNRSSVYEEKKMKTSVVLIIAAFLLASCATDYQKQGFSGGFSETRLSENIFRVSFGGNVFTSRERASDFNLLRSAEIALKSGFSYFVIVNSEVYSKTITYTTPTTSHTTGSAYVYGNYVHGSATTRTTGGRTYYFSKPGTTNTIVCFKDKPEIGGLVYDAYYLFKSIKGKYGIKRYY